MYAPQAPVAAKEVPVQTYGRYGENRKFNPSVVALVGVLHAGLFAVALQTYQVATHEKEPRILTVNLNPPPPPPPAPPEPTPEQPVVTPPTPSVRAPLSLLQLSITPTVEPEHPVLKISEEPTPTARPALPAPPAPSAARSVLQDNNLGTRMVAGDPPRYPIESRRGKEQGTVIIALILDVTGRISEISVARSSGHRRLDKAALRAVSKWRWAPTIQDGQPVMVRGQVEIPFVLVT